MSDTKKQVVIEKNPRTKWVALKIDGKIIAEMSLGQWSALVAHGKVTIDSNDRPPPSLASI